MSRNKNIRKNLYNLEKMNVCQGIWKYILKRQVRCGIEGIGGPTDSFKSTLVLYEKQHSLRKEP
jgi:hypothetical protein